MQPEMDSGNGTPRAYGLIVKQRLRTSAIKAGNHPRGRRLLGESGMSEMRRKADIPLLSSRQGGQSHQMKVVHDWFDRLDDDRKPKACVEWSTSYRCIAGIKTVGNHTASPTRTPGRENRDKDAVKRYCFEVWLADIRCASRFHPSRVRHSRLCVDLRMRHVVGSFDIRFSLFLAS